MNIGFIKATNEIDVQWFLPLAFGYLKAYLDKNLKTPVTMTLLDTTEDLDTFEIVAISATSQEYEQAIQIARTIKRKKRNIITVLGGHHITYLPETLTEDFDIGVRGEGEQTFFELINYFQENGFTIIPEKLKNIPGIVFRENNNIINTENRQLINLENLPHPDRQFGSSQYIFTSRGCPYKCSFCSSSAFWEKTRFFSAEYVVEEIEQLLEQFPDMKQIPIWDDLFIADKKRLMDIIDLVQSKGISKKVNFNFSVRANLVDDDMCNALKRLNVNGVSFGAESGSDRILKLMNKGTTVSQNQKALDLLKAYGIPVACSFIVGWPTETEEEVRKTFDFILENIAEGKLVTSNAVNILMPIPGTVLWDIAVHEGLIDLGNFNWNRLSTFASYRDSNVKSFDEWVTQRRISNSLYLNENTLPLEQLYGFMADYYHTIDLLEKCKFTQAAERDQTIQTLAAQLAGIRGSKAWKIGLLIQRLRGILAPRNSHRTQILRSLLKMVVYPIKKVQKNLSIQKDITLIKSSNLFEKDWYLEHNPDVAKTEIDPLRHYLQFGGFEGRDPGPNFSSKSYLERYSDVQSAGLNPLIHYLRNGRREGREIYL